MNVHAALLALLAFAIYAAHDVVVKFISTGLHPVQIVFFSSLLSFPLLVLMLVRDPVPGNLRPVHPWWLALRSLAISVNPASAFYAFSVLPLAETYALLFVTPLLITLLSVPLLGERVGLPRLLAVLAGFAGVLVVLRPGTTELGAGHAAALFAAFVSALQSVILRKTGSAERRVVQMLYPILATFLVMGLGLPLVYVPLHGAGLGGVAVVAVFSFAAMLLLVLAYGIGEAAIVAPMQYSQIIWAIVYGALLFGDRPDPVTLAGAAIIIASGIFIVIREARGGRSRTTPVLRARSRSYAPGGYAAGLLRKRMRGENSSE